MRLDSLDAVNPINIKTLREQVYDYLRAMMNQGEIAPGSTISLAEVSERLGISRTPLRDALLQLEIEGFVTILPRRGCVVRSLTEHDIRNLYQVIGALEAVVILSEIASISPALIRMMRRFNDEMQTSLQDDDFDRYYAANLAMHNCYLHLTSNEQLIRIVSIMKQRLYDFPRKKGFVKEWEISSTREHDELIRLMESGDAVKAAEFVRNVHWSFDVQERFIKQYYSSEMTKLEGEAG